LDALFIRLGAAIDAVGAKRIVLDTIESLFSSLPNPSIVRAELRRLFRWIKDKGVTAIVTGESGQHTLTRDGLEEYVSDCVIELSLHIDQRLASRGLRIVKYRGSEHGANEFPFVIDSSGFSLIPITSGRLDYTVNAKRLSSGIEGLDLMLGGKGFFQGSSVLVSGSSGTGKSTFMAKFSQSTCMRNERVVYFSFEESPSQISRNMSSIGIAFEQYQSKGLLHIEAARASQTGLDMHLLHMMRTIDAFKPKVVIVDPITSLSDIASQYDLKRMLVKLIDFLKAKNITTMIGGLADSANAADSSSISISSLIDSWLLLRDIEANGERTRALFIRKSRGMPHSNKVREFVITNQGVQVLDVFSGPDGVLVGGAREIGSAKQDALNILTHELAERDAVDRQSKIKLLHAQIVDIGQELTRLETSQMRLLDKQLQSKL
jgi:circadian clock protein KaiC